MPDNATWCGLPSALSVRLSVLLMSPAVDGVNFNVMAQLAPAAKLDPHVLVSLKLADDSVMPVMLSAALPVLVKVSVCAALVVPTT
jgi:hypothetical protein